MSIDNAPEQPEPSSGEVPVSPESPSPRLTGAALLAVLVVAIIWNVPFLDFLLYPLRLFVTSTHEAGHSVMALLTGGTVYGYSVSADGSGLATFAGGSRALILPAGYLGAALAGSLLLYAINRFPDAAQEIAGGLGAVMVVFSVLFARPDESGFPLALLVGGVFGLGLIVLAWRARPAVTRFALNMLAMLTALHAVLDLLFLTHNIDARRGAVANDAVAFSEDVMPVLPPVMVAICWGILATGMLAAALWFTLVLPLRDDLLARWQALRGESSPPAIEAPALEDEQVPSSG